MRWELVNAFAHITGGGIEGNTRRVVQPPLTFAVRYDFWERPAIFNFIQSAAEVPEADMRKTFNLGIGLVAVVPQSKVDSALALLRSKRRRSCGDRQSFAPIDVTPYINTMLSLGLILDT